MFYFLQKWASEVGSHIWWSVLIHPGRVIYGQPLISDLTPVKWPPVAPYQWPPLYKAGHLAHTFTACPTMKVLAVLLALAAITLYVEAKSKFYKPENWALNPFLSLDVVCGTKTTSNTVTVEDGDSYSFKTHKGKKYKGNTKCTVDYKMGDTCAKMSFVCNKFNTNNKDKKKCSKGDKVTVTANGKSKASVFKPKAHTNLICNVTSDTARRRSPRLPLPGTCLWSSPLMPRNTLQELPARWLVQRQLPLGQQQVCRNVLLLHFFSFFLLSLYHIIYYEYENYSLNQKNLYHVVLKNGWNVLFIFNLGKRTCVDKKELRWSIKN